MVNYKIYFYHLVDKHSTKFMLGTNKNRFSFFIVYVYKRKCFSRSRLLIYVKLLCGILTTKFL